MTWAHAWILGLLPIVGLILLIHSLMLRHARYSQASLGMPQQPVSARAIMRMICLYTGMALLIVCLAGPRWGTGEEVRRSRGANLFILLDCSRSMLAEDLFPTRLASAKRKILDLVLANPEHRVALLPFAGVATLRCPLTGDHKAFADLLKDCSPDLFPAKHGYQGTAIGQAVQRALSLLQNDERGQAIVLCSDGSDPDEDSVAEAAEAAKQAGVPVYGLFLGDPEREVSLTLDGTSHVMTADRSSLNLLATASNAISVSATIDDSDVQHIAKNIENTVHMAQWQEEQRIVASERYIWFLLPALVLLAIATLLPTTSRAQIKESKQA